MRKYIYKFPPTSGTIIYRQKAGMMYGNDKCVEKKAG